MTKRKKNAILAKIGDYVEVYPSTTYHNEPPLRGVVIGYEHNHPFSEKAMVKLDKYPGAFPYRMAQIKILSDKKMAEPSRKSPEIIKFLDRYSGRTQAIGTDVCIDPPFGCGARATEFRNAVSQKEYTISGLCQHCQDLIFGDE